MDRRIQRTRSAIFNAVLDLMVEKETNKISVLELCRRADINKSTFYLHYKSMNDCLQSCFQAIMDGIIEISKYINYYDIKENPEPAVDILLNEAEKNIDYLCKFKSSNICAPSIKWLKDDLINHIIKNNNFNDEDNYHEIASINFIVAGCVDAIISPLPVFKKDELKEIICKMIRT